MKYLKTYEDLDVIKYWKVKIRNNNKYKISKVLKPNLGPALYKIRMNIKQIEYWKENFKYLYMIQYIYLYLNPNSNWGHSITEFKGYENNYVYMGEVQVTPEDIKRYKISKEIEKYNL